jgi:bleomycin hydrolase
MLIKLLYRYVFQVVVPKSLAPKELLQVYESGEMVVLPPWDPMVRLLQL